MKANLYLVGGGRGGIGGGNKPAQERKQIPSQSHLQRSDGCCPRRGTEGRQRKERWTEEDEDRVLGSADVSEEERSEETIVKTSSERRKSTNTKPCS